MTKFDQIYNAIALPENLIKPIQGRMDNWAVDRYESGNFFAALADGGYSKWVGCRDANGVVVWRVDQYYPNPLAYSGITEAEFNSLML